MGVYQVRLGATEDEIFESAAPLSTPEGISVYADYVFGRMMKLSFSITVDLRVVGITPYGGIPRKDYQSWGSKYFTFNDLVNTARVSLGLTPE